MPEPTRPGAARLGAVAGAAAGLALLARPQQVAAALAPAFPRERRWLVRALGARLVVQHGAVLARPGPGLVAAGAAVDALHAASMLPFMASARYGRAARISGAVAAASALAGWALVGSHERPGCRTPAARCAAWMRPSPELSSSA